MLLVALLASWKRIADHEGIEAVDLAENVFADLCRFATREGDGQSRFAVSVFGAYWSKRGTEDYAVDILHRWLPLRIVAPRTTLAIEVTWFVLQREPGESAQSLLRRTVSRLDAISNELPASDRHQPVRAT